MNRIIPTIGLFVVGFALTASSASAQYYGHYGHGHEQHQHHAQYNHGPHHGGHSYHNHYHGGYHASDHLTYPVHPPAYAYAAPVYDEPVYADLLAGDYYCPDSGYCSQAANEIGQQYAPPQSQGQPYDYRFGQSQPFNDSSHVGHDHFNHGDTYASPSQPQDRSYVPSPALNQSPPFPPAPQQQPDSYSGIRSKSQNPPSSEPQRNEAPIQMDGPPPQI